MRGGGKRTIYNLCLEAGAKLRKVGMAGRLIAIYTRPLVYRCTRKVYTNDGEEIFKIAYSLFKGQTLDKGLTLAVKVLEAMDRVNNKYGDFTLGRR